MNSLFRSVFQTAALTLVEQGGADEVLLHSHVSFPLSVIQSYLDIHQLQHEVHGSFTIKCALQNCWYPIKKK